MIKQKLLTTTLWTLIAVMSIFSCKKEDPNNSGNSTTEGTLAMQFNVSNKKKASGDTLVPAAIMYTIKNSDGITVKENQREDLLKFGENYITAPLTFLSGDYELTSFLVLDTADVVIYASPMENTPMAEFVWDPLPISFTIEPGQVTNLVPEVIEVEDLPAEQFGYLSLSFEVKNVVRFVIKTLSYNQETNEYEVVPVFAYLLDENGDTVATNLDPSGVGLKASNGPFSRSLTNIEDNRQQSDGTTETVYTGVEVTLSGDFEESAEHTIGFVNTDFGVYEQMTFSLLQAMGYESSEAPINSLINRLIGTEYILTVNGGTGSGEYSSGREVSISAPSVQGDKKFAYWSGDIQYVEDRTLTHTKVRMESNTTLTATYGYELTVVNGHGSGVYPVGVSATISPDVPAGMEFYYWSHDGQFFPVGFEHFPVMETYSFSLTSDITIEAVYGLPCPSTFTDNRDGKVYKAVQIGNQCWMAENLNVGNMISSSTTSSDNGVIEKYIYDNNPANEDLGGLYKFDEAMQYSQEESTRGICPIGWHIPSHNEWKEMEAEIGVVAAYDYENSGGDVDASKLFPGGETGFDALFAGRMDYNGNFSGGSATDFHTSSMVDPNTAISRSLSINDMLIFNLIEGYAISVRCVKD